MTVKAKSCRSFQSAVMSGVAVLAVFGPLAGCAGPDRRVDQAPAGSEDPAVGKLGWMSGSWVATDEDGRREEHWTIPAGGTMIGMNREVAGSSTRFFEYLRIESRPDGIYYMASPKGRAATAFRLVESESSASPRAVFENPEHDFPQRIIYWLEGDVLHARIEGTQNGQPAGSEWSWRRAARASRP